MHLVAALNYYEIIPLLKDYGADLNILSADHLTPLMVAAARGLEKSVKKLMRLGAVFWTEDLVGANGSQHREAGKELENSSYESDEDDDRIDS